MGHRNWPGKPLTSDAQLNSGLIELMFEQITLEMHHIEPILYMSHIHEYLRNIDGCIQIESSWLPKMQMEHNKALTDLFMKAKAQGCTKKKIKNGK